MHFIGASAFALHFVVTSFLLRADRIFTCSCFAQLIHARLPLLVVPRPLLVASALLELTLLVTHLVLARHVLALPLFVTRPLLDCPLLVAHLSLARHVLALSLIVTRALFDCSLLIAHLSLARLGLFALALLIARSLLESTLLVARALRFTRELLLLLSLALFASDPVVAVTLFIEVALLDPFLPLLLASLLVALRTIVAHRAIGAHRSVDVVRYRGHVPALALLRARLRLRRPLASRHIATRAGILTGARTLTLSG